jgi:hypothetical protein
MSIPPSLPPDDHSLLQQLHAAGTKNFALVIFRGDGKVETTILPENGGSSIKSPNTDDRGTIQNLVQAGLVGIISQAPDKWEFYLR